MTKSVAQVSGATGSNIAVLCGVLKSDPQFREVSELGGVREFVVVTKPEGKAVNTPVVCADSLGENLSEGDRVTVIGSVQMRFFASGGRLQSRTELVASHVFGSRSRAARTRALSLAVAEINSL